MVKKNKTKKEVTTTPTTKEESLSIAIEEVPSLYRRQMIAWQQKHYEVGIQTLKLLAGILEELKK